MAVAEARVHTTRLDRNFDPAAVTDLANALDEKGNYPQALDLHQKVLEFLQRQLGCDHPSVAATYGNMGLVYDSMGDFPKALEYHNHDLEIMLRVFGPALYSLLGL